MFLYREVLGVELPWLDDVVRAKKPQRLPTVLNRAKVTLVLERMEGTYGLMARLWSARWTGERGGVFGYNPPSSENPT